MKKIDETFVKENFGKIWPAHVETLTRFMIECRRHFHSDLDLLLIMCVIGDRSLSRGRTPRDLTYKALMEQTWEPHAPEALNARSIADFSGIPRETVRRKVDDLIALGWVERDEKGHLRATHKSAVDLAPLSEASFRYIARMAVTLSTV